MSGYSKYPSQIDSSVELPITTDNVTPVNAETVNRLRDAVLAVEAELGVDPSREFGTVRARLDALEEDVNNLRIELEALGTGGGGANVEVGKIRVYRSGSVLAGAAVNTNQTVTWNGTSTLVTGENATASSTQLVPGIAGNFIVLGQLSIQPTVDAISGITIEILHNASTIVHTVSDFGAVWSIGTTRSIPFEFTMDLDAADTLEVRWRHSGSASSTQQLMFGDDLSWFAIAH